MTNKERIDMLCECLIHIIHYLPAGTEWIEDNVREIMENVDVDEKMQKQSLWGEK